MRLTRAEIRNFRSIEEVTLELEPQCRVLVGINESGKSNILHALALLDHEREPKRSDMRFPRPDEKPDQEGYVRFVFTLDKAERLESFETLRTKTALSDDTHSVITIKGKPLTLAQFCDSRTQVLHQVDLNEESRRWTRWSLPDECELADWIRRPQKGSPDIAVTDVSGEQKSLGELALVDDRLLDDVARQHVDVLSVQDFNRIATTDAVALAKGRVPGCLFWEFTPAMLLPGLIPMSTFTANPATCLPLKCMFELAGYDGIATTIEQESARPNGVRNLLGRVARIATEHLRSVWKDYKGIELELRPSGDNIEAVIKDTHNVYDMARRSDGFKRFVSFLFLVSAKAKTKTLEDTLLLHDEPDTSLHPSGARHLCTEMIRIGRTNYVVYSTHSIFMIDKDNIGRHYIVKKQNEATTVEQVGDSNIVDEEVIYNALGHSVFADLKKHNIVCEGWQDKMLLRTALSRVPAKYAAVKEKLQRVGTCHARGAKDVARVSSFLDLMGRGCVVLSDGDAPAREKQREFRGPGQWFRYDELVDGSGIVTAEDFLKPEVLAKEMGAIAAEHTGLKPFAAEELNAKDGRLRWITQWIRDGGVEPEEARRVIDAMKGRVFEELKPSHIEPRYYDYLEGLARRIAMLDDEGLK